MCLLYQWYYMISRQTDGQHTPRQTVMVRRVVYGHSGHIPSRPFVHMRGDMSVIPVQSTPHHCCGGWGGV